MSLPIKLSIVFLNFNKRAETEYTCKQLQKLCAKRKDIEIIAVDNGSKDGTAKFLQLQPGITSILLPENNGIAGYNAGFNKARGEFILVLDDDSCPKHLAGIEQALSKFTQHPEIGIIAAHIQTPEGKPQRSWHLPKTKSFSPSPFFIGCGFIIKRDLFSQIGWYPEKFFLYQNEIDISFKVRLQGYEIYYDPECVVVHRGIPSQRPGWRRVFYPTRNTLWLIRCYYPQPLMSYLIISRLIIGLIRALNFREVKAFYKAACEGLTEPVRKTILPNTLRQLSTPFSRQNNLICQLFRRT